MLKSLRKKNKGFTLVELIVVIVILAILIGVTIGGIYKYVSQSRTNTDQNNASSLQSTLSSMCAEEDIYSWANADKNKTVVIEWTDAVAVASIAAGDASTANQTGKDAVVAHIKELCPDGLPASKTKKGFKFTINSGDGNPVVKVEVKS